MRITHFYTPGTKEDLVSNMPKKLVQEWNKYDCLLALNTSFTTGCVLDGKQVIGSKTTGAFMLHSKDQLGADYKKIRDGLTVNGETDAAICQQIDFSSKRKRASMLVDLDKFQAPEEMKA